VNGAVNAVVEVHPTKSELKPTPRPKQKAGEALGALHGCLHHQINLDVKGSPPMKGA